MILWKQHLLMFSEYHIKETEMKKRTFIIVISKYCSVLYFMILLLASCSIDDGRDECPDGLWITFKNKYATQQRSGTVDQIDLFVFDEQGTLCLHDTEYEVPMDGSFRKRLWINPGNYTFVAWTGFSEGNTYSCDDFIIGKTRMDDLKVNLSRLDDNKVNYRPGLLLNATVTELPVKLKRNEEVVMPMVQLNNQVNVIVRQKGVKEVNDVGFSSLELNIADNNSSYFFDNKLDESAPAFQYVPFFTKKELSIIDCDFYVLKLQERKDEPILTIYDPIQDKYILKNNLIDLIRKVNEIYGSQIDLERDTYFKIEVVLDQTYVIFSIAINGWVIVKQGAVVG